MGKPFISTRASSQDLNFRVMDLGLVPYGEAWEIQKELVKQRAAKKVPDTLLLVEHFPVITAGRKTRMSPTATIPVFEIERGGDETLHSPGQLVGYPIIYLPKENRDLHEYLRRIEEVLIHSLEDFGLQAGRREGLTGVWIGAKKIASIGVACKKWVTYHGFALNVNNDLSLFQKIKPCGLDPKIMTSMGAELDSPVSMEVLKEKLVARFKAEFGV